MRFMLNESNAFVQYEQQKGERGSLIELMHATAFDGTSSAAYVSTEDGDTVAERCRLYPCFILTNATDASGVFGEAGGLSVVKHPAFTAVEWSNARAKCRGAFVTNGPNVVPYCRQMEKLGGPAELASYVAGLMERPGGPNDAGYMSQCKELNSLQTQEELHSTFVDVFNHSAGFFAGTFGGFIQVKGGDWYTDWVNTYSLWRYTDIVDDQTRSWAAYVIVENKQPGTQMFGLVKFEFHLHTNGKFTAEKTLHQILIPQFQYGLGFGSFFGGKGESFSAENNYEKYEKGKNQYVFTLEVLCILSIALMSLKEVFDIGIMIFHTYKAALSGHSRGTMGALCTELMKNLLDDVMLGVCWFIVRLRFRYVSECADFYIRYHVMLPQDINLSQIIDDFNEIARIKSTWFHMWTVLFILLVLQLFRYFAFDPRMKVVTETITRSSEKLLPVLIVFIAVLATYCSFGMLLYGEQLEHFK
jgi:hypothetical protein